MKKITILAVAALAISFASCKKDRTCACTGTTTATYTGGSATTTDNPTSTKISKVKKSAANCHDTETTTTYTGGSSVTTTKCTLS